MTHDKLAESMEYGDTTLFTLLGQDFTYHEVHAIALGCVGFVLGERGLALLTIFREPQYFIASLIVTYLIGRHYARDKHDES